MMFEIRSEGTSKEVVAQVVVGRGRGGERERGNVSQGVESAWDMMPRGG